MRWAPLLLLLGCAAESKQATVPTAPARTLTVLAASSLTDAYLELEPLFEAEHPGVDVALSFAGSQALATQVRHGIGADVLASADREHALALAREGLVEAPRAFVDNALVLAVSDAWPAPLDLPGLPAVGSLVVGDDEVPVGRYTRALLDAAEARYGAGWRAGVEARIVSREPNVRLALAKVALGEADAAIVYATDLRAAEGVRGVDLPAGLAPAPACFHARLVDAPQPELARAWMDLVESGAGQAVLARHGFRIPAAP